MLSEHIVYANQVWLHIRNFLKKKKLSKTLDLPAECIIDTKLLSVISYTTPQNQIKIKPSLASQSISNPNTSLSTILSEFNNYHKNVVQDHVRVPKFWLTWCTWANTKQHISHNTCYQVIYQVIFLTIFPKLAHFDLNREEDC